jgi:hypothetical protein
VKIRHKIGRKKVQKTHGYQKAPFTIKTVKYPTLLNDGRKEAQEAQLYRGTLFILRFLRLFAAILLFQVAGYSRVCVVLVKNRVDKFL